MKRCELPACRQRERQRQRELFSIFNPGRGHSDEPARTVVGLAFGLGASPQTPSKQVRAYQTAKVISMYSVYTPDVHLRIPPPFPLPSPLPHPPSFPWCPSLSVSSPYLLDDWRRGLEFQLLGSQADSRTQCPLYPKPSPPPWLSEGDCQRKVHGAQSHGRPRRGLQGWLAK